MTILKRIWGLWKRVGQFIGDAIARIVLTIFYFTVAVPFGLGVRLMSDPLRIKEFGRPSDTHWLDREPTEDSIKDARRLF